MKKFKKRGNLFEQNPGKASIDAIETKVSRSSLETDSKRSCSTGNQSTTALRSTVLTKSCHYLIKGPLGTSIN